MTNPYQGFEYKMHAEDYLPAAEQITSADPATLKGLMEVWRDTANQLNAEKMLAEKSHQNYVSVHEKYMSEMNEKLKLEDEVKKEKEHLEKMRRHRDELAQKVKRARATRTALSERLAEFDNEKCVIHPIEILREISERLNIDLGDSNEQPKQS